MTGRHYPNLPVESASSYSEYSFETFPTAPPVLKPTTVQMTWDFLPGSPACIAGVCSAVVGDKAYVKSGASVWQFSSTRSSVQWSPLTDHPLQDFALVSVNSELLSVGGCDEKRKFSNKLYSFVERKWVLVKKYPPMPTKRSKTTAVYASNMLIVAGGENDSILPTVEVLTTSRKQWDIVSSLPFATIQPSVSISQDDTIYLHPGYTIRSSNHGFSVLKCKLLDLSTSISDSACWITIKSLPVMSSSLAVINGLLFAFGGESAKDVPSREIHQYNSDTDSWETVDDGLSIARFRCVTILLPGNKLMVVGGNSGHETTELATIATIM